MLLIPTGQENSEVRRTPWVSIVLIALNILFFLGVRRHLKPEDRSGELERKGHEIQQYLAEHPYLELPTDLAVHLDAETLRDLEEVRQASRARGEAPAPATLARERQDLQRLTDELFAIARRSPLESYGFIPAHPALGAIVQSLFVHAGWLHLVGNMWFLFITGPFLEDVYGRVGFTFLYLLSGIVGALAHAWQFPTSLVPVVGASGAIAGVMGAFLLRLGRSRIRFLCIPIVLLPFFRFRFGAPAYVVLPLWLLEQLVNVGGEGGESGVAWWAHLGGFAFGLAAAAVLKATRVEERFINPSIEKEVSWEQNPDVVKAGDARARGDLLVARLSIEKALREDPGNVDAWIQAVEIARLEGNAEAIARTSTRLLDLFLSRGERALALQLVHEAGDRRDPLPARFLLSAAGLLEREGHLSLALDWYRDLATRYPSDPASLKGLFRTAEILKGRRDARASAEALDAARRHPVYSAEWERGPVRS